MIVFFDGVHYWLADGFHRWHAHRKIERDTIACDVRNGTLDEARWFSYSANQTHGIRRKNPDKAKACRAALLHPNGAKLSDHQIAEHVGVDVKTVGKYRAELAATMEIPQSDTRTGRDGRTINTSGIGKTSKPDAPRKRLTAKEWDAAPVNIREMLKNFPAPVAKCLKASPLAGSANALQHFHDLTRKLSEDDRLYTAELLEDGEFPTVEEALAHLQTEQAAEQSRGPQPSDDFDFDACHDEEPAAKPEGPEALIERARAMETHSCAMDCARVAITQLERIPSRDAERRQALEKVESWIKSQSVIVSDDKFSFDWESSQVWGSGYFWIQQFPKKHRAALAKIFTRLAEEALQ